MKRELVLMTLAKHGDEAVQTLYAGMWCDPVYEYLAPTLYKESEWRLNPEFFRGRVLTVEEAVQLHRQGEKVEMLTENIGLVGGTNNFDDSFRYRLAPAEQPKEEPTPVVYPDTFAGGMSKAADIADWMACSTDDMHRREMQLWVGREIRAARDGANTGASEQPKPAPKRRPLRPEELIGAMLYWPATGQYNSINEINCCGIWHGIPSTRISFESLAESGWRYVVRGEKPKPCYVEE